jgi:hypothetical protein
MRIWMEHRSPTGIYGILYVFLHENKSTTGAWITARVNPKTACPWANYSNNFRIGSIYKIPAILLWTNQANSMEDSLYCENDSPLTCREISYSYGIKMLIRKTVPVLSRVNSVNGRKNIVSLKPWSLRFGLPSSLLQLGLPIKILCAYAMSHTCARIMCLHDERDRFFYHSFAWKPNKIIPEKTVIKATGIYLYSCV